VKKIAQIFFHLPEYDRLSWQISCFKLRKPRCTNG